MEWFWVFVALVVVVALGLWLSWTANRLDRVHHRIEVARASLDTHLLRRSGAALELATSGTLDPARSLLLVDVASEARAAEDDFESAESDLSEALRAVLADADEVRALLADEEVGPLLTELAADCRKVELSRRFHNDVCRVRALAQVAAPGAVAAPCGARGCAPDRRPRRRAPGLPGCGLIRFVRSGRGVVGWRHPPPLNREGPQ